LEVAIKALSARRKGKKEFLRRNRGHLTAEEKVRAVLLLMGKMA